MNLAQKAAGLMRATKLCILGVFYCMYNRGKREGHLFLFYSILFFIFIFIRCVCFVLSSKLNLNEGRWKGTQTNS